MKLKIILLSFAFLMFLNVTGQNLVTGNWKLIKIENHGAIKEMKVRFNFSDNGKILERGRRVGRWKLSLDKKEITLKSSFSKDEFNGVHKVITLTKTDFVFSKNKSVYFLKRVNMKAILERNKNSKLMGTWKLNHKDFDDLFLILKLPNQLKFVSANSNSVSTEKGEWEYLPATNELNLEGITSILKGKNRVKDVSSNFLALVMPRETLAFNKVNSLNIEWLKFKQEDLEELENEEAKLPEAWRSSNKFIASLSKYKALEYKYGNYIKDADALIYSKILNEIKVDLQKQSISITNKLITKNDTVQTSENYKDKMMNARNLFFPEKEPDYYKVIGKEKINDENCTVMEAILGEEKIKYWMIDNYPGVYAKIIRESTNEFFNETNYSIKTLTKSIKKN